MRIFKKISNILFGVSIFIAIYTLFKVYLLKSQLPQGVCPVNTYNNLIYVSIGLLVISFIVMVIIEIKEKK